MKLKIKVIGILILQSKEHGFHQERKNIYIYGIINSKEKREEIMNKPNQRLKYDIHFFLTLSHHPNSSYKKTLREREREHTKPVPN